MPSIPIRRMKAKMAAYVIGHILVRDPVVWQDYVSQVGATIRNHGGEVLFRGMKQGELNGALEADRVVALRFADIEAARRWHDSRAYQKLIPLRDAAADVTLVMYQD
jgi:uncharacterized protein (DUF1330 family)